MGRTLVLTQDFPPGFTGGIASWADDLARAHAAAGRPVTVLARATGDTAGHDAALPYPVKRMWGRSWGRWQGVWARLHAGRHLERGDRLVCATWGLAQRVAPWARERGVAVGVAFHGSDLTRLVEVPAGLERVATTATALLPVSGFLADGLMALVPQVRDRVHVLPMPLDTSPEPATGPRAGLLMVARLTQLKGGERAVALAARLDMPLTVVGEGPALDTLKAAATAQGARVHFPGRLDRAALTEHYRRAAAVVLLPRSDTDGTGAEGLGLCFLEAAVHGTPAIGCATGGVPEAVGPGLVLADPDTLGPAEVAAARALLDDPTASQRAAAWVRAHHGPAACLALLDRALGG